MSPQSTCCIAKEDTFRWDPITISSKLSPPNPSLHCVSRQQPREGSAEERSKRWGKKIWSDHTRCAARQLRPNPAQAATSHGSSSNAAYVQAPSYQHAHSSAPARMTGGQHPHRESAQVHLLENTNRKRQMHDTATRSAARKQPATHQDYNSKSSRYTLR